MAARASIAAASALAALLAATSPVGTADARSLCGVARWSVKTLQDRPALLPVRRTTVRYLVTRPAPRLLPSTRLPFERHVFRVTGFVTLFRHEDDGDLHLVL